MYTQVWKLIGWLAAVGGWNRHPPLSTILPVSLTLSLMLVSFSREESSIFLPKDIPNCKMNRGENRVGLRKFSLSEMQIFIFFSSSFYDISPGMVGRFLVVPNQSGFWRKRTGICCTGLVLS